MLPYQRFSETFPRAMVLMGPKIYGEFGITAQQARALREIGNGPITGGELSASFGVKLPAAARLLRRLEEKGWVTKAQDKNDRRVFWLELTPEGALFKDKLQTKREEVIKAMFDKLTPQEQEEVAKGIELLLKSLKI